MAIPRGLSAEEAAIWARLAKTVTPLAKGSPRNGEGNRRTEGLVVEGADQRGQRPQPGPLHQPPLVRHLPLPRPGEDRAPRTLDRHGLDSSWEKKLARAALEPDFTLDLHGASLDAAHGRLDHGLTQAKALGARLVLVITGKPRPVDPADRGQRRGAIRAKLLDWLAAGPHEADIAAVRGAHRRHGGEGALYIVLKRVRGRQG